jgi:hypothetical protein
VVEHWIVVPVVAGSIPVTHPNASQQKGSLKRHSARSRAAWLGVLGLVGAGLCACGDDENPKPQAAAFFALNQPSGSACTLVGRTYEVPLGTGRLTGSTGGNPRTDRAVDGGETVVVCSVGESNTAGSFTLNLELRTPDILFFGVRGTARSGAPATVSVSLQTEGSQLEQSDCTATVEVVQSGAVWLRELECPEMPDALRTRSLCHGSGGVIFENCSR